MPTRHGRLGAISMILAGVTSLQFGAALAATAFPLVGPVTVVALRLVTSAVVLVVVGGGLRMPARSRADLGPPLAMGVVLAVMNTSVYAALDRLPLGVVITLEFLGPLAVTFVHSRRRSDVVLGLAALAGVALLTGGLAGADDLVGVAFTLVGAAGWACYIVLNRGFGRRAADGGLALSSIVAAVLVSPFALLTAGSAALQPRVLVIGLAVGILSSAVPYTLDRLALRRIDPGPFGVLMSINPAVAALAGLVLLGQALTPRQLTGMAIVVAVSALAVGGQRPPGRRDATDRPTEPAAPTTPTEPTARSASSVSVRAPATPPVRRSARSVTGPASGTGG